MQTAGARLSLVEPAVFSPRYRGTAPNRIFNIEWRTVYFADATMTANYELRLYEGQSRFDVIYGTVAHRQQQRHSGSAERRYRPLTSTSATAQVAPLLAAKATSCKPAVRRRRLPLAQVQQLLLLRRRPQQLRPRQLLRQQLQPPRRLLVPQRLLRRRGLLHHRGHVRLHIPDRKTDRSAISNQLVS